MDKPRLRSASTPGEVVLKVDHAGEHGAVRFTGLNAWLPEDVAVIGCDDLPAAAYDDVPLTTLAHPAEAVGARLAQLFVEGMKEPARIAGCQVALPLRLVVRESCGARCSGKLSAVSVQPSA